MEGTIKWFDTTKGFGFIHCEEEGKDENVKKARVLFEQKLIDDTQAELGQLEEEIQLKAEA